MHLLITFLLLCIDDSNLLPSSLVESLVYYRVHDVDVKKTDLVLQVRRACSAMDAAPSYVGELCYTVDEAGETLLRARNDPKCELCVALGAGRATLSVFPDVDRENPALTEQARLMLRVLFEEYGAFHGVLSLHSCAVVNGRQAVCFTGPSGAGKSTLARNCLRAAKDAFILNGDRPALRELDGVFNAFGAPWSGSEAYYINDNAPLKAVVEVRKHTANLLYRLPPRAAYALLLKRVSKPMWDQAATFEILSTVERLVKSVPVYRYYCKDDPSAGEYLLGMLNAPDAIPVIDQGGQDMRIKSKYVVRKVMEDYVAMPVGPGTADERSAIALDETGAFIWEKLRQPVSRRELLDCILAEFDVDENTASADLDAFLQNLRDAHALEE